MSTPTTGPENGLRRAPERANLPAVVRPEQHVPHAQDAIPVDEMGSGNGLVEYWRVILRYKGTVVLLFALGGIAGFLYTIPQTPIYQAHATLEVRGLNENFLNMSEVNPTATASLDPSYDILTQVKLLESSTVRESAAKKLKERPSSGPVKTFQNSRLDAWKVALRLKPSEPVTRETLIDMAAGNLSARASGTTRIIDLTAESPDPIISAEFVNTLAEEFIGRDLEGRLVESTQTSEWLARQLNELKIRLEKSEDGLQAYAAAVGLQLGSTQGEKGQRENVAEEKLRQLQTEMLAAQSERVKAQSKYELISSAPLDSLPQVVDDPGLRDYQGKLTELRRQHAELSTSLTKENAKVVKLQAQIDEIEGALKRERGNIVGRIKNDYEAATRREAMLSAEYGNQLKLVNDQAGKSIHYDILRREVETNRQIYEAMLQKVKEAGIASAMRASNYRVIDPARPPGSPYKPDARQSSMLGSALGLAFGVMFVLVRERADRNLQQPGDATHFLGLPELGVIPADQQPGLYIGLTGPVVPKEGQRPDVSLATYRRRPSLLAESFHDTLTSILFSGQNGLQPQVLVMSSASPAEGKTTISSNLAAALADINQRVLLIDADMRRPRMHNVFGLPNGDGLSTLLKINMPIIEQPQEPYIHETEVPNLWLLPSGPAVSNASNLLYSPRLAELIRAVRSGFDFVIIDTPPMMQLADARIMGQHCDAAILVVRSGKTTRDAARAAKDKFRQDGTYLLGVILNHWTPGVNGYGYDSKYYDRYAKYYSAADSD